MFDHRVPAPGLSAAVVAVAALLAGLLAGLQFWGWALAPLGGAIYFTWAVFWRVRQVRSALMQLRTAVAALPEGEIPGLSTAPGVELVFLVEALEEMTVRVREQLTASEEERNRLRAAFTSMRDAVIALGATGRVALINPAAERLFEMVADDVVGRGVLQVIRHEQLARALHETLTKGRPATMEFESFEVPSRHFQAELAPVLTGRGEPSGAVAVLHDVTQLRHLEEMRSQFVANVSHELRTPITSIKGYLETLLDGAMDDRDTCRRFLTILSQEADRLANLVDDLLDLSRLEADTVPLRLENLELRQEAAGVLELLQPIAAACEVHPELQIPAGLQVHADSAMLRQALLNLLDNAIKYSQGGGRVWIEAAPAQDGRQIVVSVGDTGPGIPSSHLEKLFERFYRVDKARSRAVGGTGLGLAIVKHIAERHGGKAWAESTLGQGSRFSISFPAVPPAGP